MVVLADKRVYDIIFFLLLMHTLSIISYTEKYQNTLKLFEIAYI